VRSRSLRSPGKTAGRDALLSNYVCFRSEEVRRSALEEATTISSCGHKGGVLVSGAHATAIYITELPAVQEIRCSVFSRGGFQRRQVHLDHSHHGLHRFRMTD
jgi:hypothetical protein